MSAEPTSTADAWLGTYEPIPVAAWVLVAGAAVAAGFGVVSRIPGLEAEGLIEIGRSATSAADAPNANHRGRWHKQRSRWPRADVSSTDWWVEWRPGRTCTVGSDAAWRDAVLWYPSSTYGAAAMFSVAVKGYGIVIWDGDGEWRTFGATESLSATLTARVEFALDALAPGPAEFEVREALLSMSGAGLLSADCEHRPGECDGETTFG